MALKKVHWKVHLKERDLVERCWVEKKVDSMAEWWEFSREDVLRVGLTEEPHPDAECNQHARSAASLADAFAEFLESGDDERSDGKRTRPPPRSPTGRLPPGVSLASRAIAPGSRDETR